MSNFKYYLAFDVGVTNLAYCLGKCDISTDIIKGIEIIDWGIFDISSNKLLCNYETNIKTNKKCNKKSKQYLLKDNNDNHSNYNNILGYCNKHINELKKKSKTIKSFRTSNNDLFKNDFDETMEKLFSKLSGCNNKICDGLYDFPSLPINNVEILIENQPSLINPKVKSISVAIYSFFLEKKINSKNIIKSVNFMSPSEKTNTKFTSSLNNILTKYNCSIDIKNYNFKDYKQRKNFTVTVAKNILYNLTQSTLNICSTVFFELTNKKDDLADAFIYIIARIIK